ncbi:MAG: hypothetical protein E7426_02740 [Ruminococcaceae bacterium]|jgi:hypothetical protein|nr:hypothetical protein [Oscillospiraceae bacterium]
MEPVKILWLYSDLLDLYGDRGNLTAVTCRLRGAGIPFAVEEKSIYDELTPEDYQLIYAGPGKDRNLLRAAEHLAGYGDALRRSVEKGTVFLVTGNAQLLFGREIRDADGTSCPAAGLFDYVGRITGEVFIDDVVLCPVFDPGKAVYGFINRTSQLIPGEDSYPLFRVVYAQKPIGSAEGTLYRNFIGSWALGPLLAKNPTLLSYVLRQLTGREVPFDSSLQDTALLRTLAEFPAVNH